MHRTQSLEMSHVKPSLFTIGGDISDLWPKVQHEEHVYTSPKHAHSQLLCADMVSRVDSAQESG